VGGYFEVRKTFQFIGNLEEDMLIIEIAIKEM
jgi:hypothetical protein